MFSALLCKSITTSPPVAQAAMYVQLTEAVEFCCSFLLAKICLENCAEVMRLLEDFSVGVEGVQEQLDNFLLDNFVPLMSRPDFLSYLSLERLQVLISNSSLKANFEKLFHLSAKHYSYHFTDFTAFNN